MGCRIPRSRGRLPTRSSSAPVMKSPRSLPKRVRRPARSEWRQIARRGMRRMRRGDEFRGVAIATAALQDVVRRSTHAIPNAETIGHPSIRRRCVPLKSPVTESRPSSVALGWLATGWMNRRARSLKDRSQRPPEASRSRRSPRRNVRSPQHTTARGNVCAARGSEGFPQPRSRLRVRHKRHRDDPEAESARSSEARDAG
jgi:hypothetical protein